MPGSTLAPAFVALVNASSREDIEAAFRLIAVTMHGRGIKPAKPEMDLLGMIR